MSARVRLYSRRTCGLCDEAREVLLAERESGPVPFEVEEIFVDGDPGLEERYGLRVPVVLVDGVEEFEYAVEPRRLRALLAG